ncbi:MAG: hypothetical protein AB7J25_29995 [Pseudonocardia sp.]
MLRELAPLLAEEGIHRDERGEFSDLDVPDLQTLQRALDRAVERQNLALFTPTGHARELPPPRCGRSARPSPPATPPAPQPSWTRWCPSRPTRPWRPSPDAPG